MQEEGASCSSRLICMAAPGYDGPTGLGTPDGVEAFQPQHAPGSGGEGEPTAPPPPPARSAAVTPPAATQSGPPPQPQLSAATLTLKALVALNRRRPTVSAIAFAFACNVLADVRVTLVKLVRRHSRRHSRTTWQAVAPGRTIVAYPGRNSGRFAGRIVLGHGRYRVQLAAAGGAVQTIEFQIG
jgi:hypothetical protein